MNRRKFVHYASLGAGCLGMGMALGRAHSTVLGKRIGIIGLDTSHSEVFTRLINNGGADMLGYRVTAAYPHGSKDIASALKMKPDIMRAVEGLGVKLVDSIDALLQEVDGVLLESNDGRVHLEQALPVFRSGKRVFIDKPIAPSLADAQAIFNVAEQYKTPVFTSSALRFDAMCRR